MAGTTEPWSIGWFRATLGKRGRGARGFPEGGSKIGRGRQAIALGQELRGDAQRDLVRMIGAELEADGTVKLRGAPDMASICMTGPLVRVDSIAARH